MIRLTLGQGNILQTIKLDAKEKSPKTFGRLWRITCDISKLGVRNVGIL